MQRVNGFNAANCNCCLSCGPPFLFGFCYHFCRVYIVSRVYRNSDLHLLIQLPTTRQTNALQTHQPHSNSRNRTTESDPFVECQRKGHKSVS